MFLEAETLDELLYQVFVLKENSYFCFSLVPVVKEITPIIYDNLYFLKEAMFFFKDKHNVNHFFLIEHDSISDAFKAFH